MSYKAVLFDMDGTLLDTLEDLRDSTNHVLRKMGYPERSLEEMRRFVGNGAEKQIRRAVPEGTSEEKIMETLAAYRAYYQDHCQIKTRVYDGLLNMLSELKEKGIHVGLVRPITVWPFPYDAVREACCQPGVKAVLDVELNEGQMLEDVKLAINGAKHVDFFGHCGSQMPSTDEIVTKILSMKEGK